jgi:hypothetical protein
MWERSVVVLWCIHLVPIYTTRLLSLYNSLNRLLSPYNLTCDLYRLYLMIFIYFDLLTWSYSDSSSTWSSSQLGFLLNRISHPCIFLFSDLIYSGIDSALLKLKVLTPPLDSDSTSIWTCFLNLLLEFIRTTYLILTRLPYPSLIWLHQCLSGVICSYPAELLYWFFS